jgi:AraC-like DNA-binding protein
MHITRNGTLQQPDCHIQKRLQFIRQFFQELAQGNCTARLQVGGCNDRLSRLETTLNLVAGEYGSVLDIYGFSNAAVPNLPLASRLSGQDTAARFELIRDIHNFILCSLDEPLPSVREIARMFGTNECTLKRGFHSLFGTSIHRFYTEHRLLLAHELITNTSESLKSIPYMCGFNDYSTFAKAFRKKYGSSPGALKRAGNDP